MNDELCSIEDIKAIVPVYNRWDVNADGTIVEFYANGDDFGNIEEYVCENCGGFFTPEKPFSYLSIALAWGEVLKHIKEVA